MAEKRYTEDPEHKHLDDHVFGKTAAAEQEMVERQLDETDADPSEVQEDVDGRRPEPGAGGRAERSAD